MDELPDGVFQEFGENQRHGKEYIRFVFSEGRFEVCRYWRDAEHYKVHSEAERREHVIDHSEDVRIRKDADIIVFPSVREVFRN